MKSKYLFIIFIALFSVSSCAESNIESNVESLNSKSIELFGLSVIEISKLLTFSQGDYFIPLEALESRGDMQQLKILEEKGYLAIQQMSKEMSEKMLGDIPFNSTDRRISLTEKGKELVRAFE